LASVSKEEKESLTKTQSEQNYNDYRERLVFLSQLYPDRTSMVAVLNYINYSKDRELIDKIAANIYAKHPGYAPLVTYYKAKEETAANARKMVVGAIAPDFEFPSPDGKMVGPKDYRGKILVIDFWASWCKPCVAEIPNLKKLHEKYKENGLEVLSVSIDKDSKEWLLALEKYAMPWKQVLAPKAGADITKLYQFNLIPFIIIIDREGKIIGKNQRGEALDNFIKERIK
jgi:thiol-disulfide isomerase/thioredoxin